MSQFNFIKKQDKYIIKNEEETPLHYEVKKLFDCSDYISISDGEILSNEEKTFCFSEDGEYIINIGGDKKKPIFIKHYNKLLEALIESTLKNICGEKCNCNCGEESTYCDLLINRARIDTYKGLVNPQGTGFYSLIYDHIKCLIIKPLYCGVDEEIILGETKCNEKIIKQLLALDYLAIYFYELSQVCTSEDIHYLNDKFYTETMFCCIQELGINIKEIQSTINNNMGKFTISNQAYINQPPNTPGNFSLEVQNRASTVLNLSMFTTQTTPPYSDPEGDAVHSIRFDTLPLIGVLQLKGVDIQSGEIVGVSDVNAGFLTYESPLQDELIVASFNFSLSDNGSKLFSN